MDIEKHLQRKSSKVRNSHRGSVMNLVATMICVLAMTVIVLGYLGCIGLLERKAAISQVVRKYLLRMETIGYLTEDDSLALEAELTELGATELDFAGSTLNEVEYGTKIVLKIKGKIAAEGILTGDSLFGTLLGTVRYEFSEQKMSTAKH